MNKSFFWQWLLLGVSLGVVVLFADILGRTPFDDVVLYFVMWGLVVMASLNLSAVLLIFK